MRDDVDHDFDLDGADPVPAPPGPGLFSAWTGGLAALAGLAALGGWAWVVTSQDPGDVPVIAAMEREVRVRPEGPETGLTPDRDATVYDAAVATVREEREATLAPPPPRPTAEDVAPRAIAAAIGAGQGGAEDTDPPPGPAPERTVERAPGDDPAAPRDGAPAEIPPAAEDAAATTGPVPPEGTGSTAAPATGPVVAARPVYLARRMRAASKEAIAETVALAKRAAASPWQIQLGAFRDPRVTREQWQLISGDHADLLQGRALAVQETVSGGETFYRLRVGPFSDARAAANLCEALQARGQTCITAENR